MARELVREKKRVEECFGWMKSFGLMYKLRQRGIKTLAGNSGLLLSGQKNKPATVGNKIVRP